MEESMIVVLSMIAAGLVAGGGVGWLLREWGVKSDATVAVKTPQLIPLIRAAHATVLIATDFEPRFYSQEEVTSAFDQVIKNGVQPRFLVDGQGREWYSDELAWYNLKMHEKGPDEKGLIEIREASLPHHWMVLDSSVHEEYPHSFQQYGPKAKGATLPLEFPECAKAYTDKFEVIWKGAKPWTGTQLP